MALFCRCYSGKFDEKNFRIFSLRRLLIMSRLTSAFSSNQCRKLTTLSSSSTLLVQNRYAQRNRRFVPTTTSNARRYSQFVNDRANLLSVKPTFSYSRRRFVGWVPAVVRSVLKIRYLLLGGAIGGGASLAKVISSRIRFLVLSYTITFNVLW